MSSFDVSACLISTVSLYTETDTYIQALGPLLEGLGNVLYYNGTDEDIAAVLMDVCGDSFNGETTNISCDLDGSDIFTALSTACDQVGGKVVLHKVSVCGDVMGEANVTGIESISLESIPFCMATECADGLGFMDILVSGLALLDEIIPAVEGETSLSDQVNEVFNDGCLEISIQSGTGGPPTGDVTFSVASEKGCLTAKNFKVGSPIKTAECKGFEVQMWMVDEIGQIHSMKDTRKCLMKDGASLILGECDDSGENINTQFGYNYFDNTLFFAKNAFIVADVTGKRVKMLNKKIGDTSQKMEPIFY